MECYTKMVMKQGKQLTDWLTLEFSDNSAAILPYSAKNYKRKKKREIKLDFACSKFFFKCYIHFSKIIHYTYITECRRTTAFVSHSAERGSIPGRYRPKLF